MSDNPIRDLTGIDADRLGTLANAIEEPDYALAPAPADDTLEILEDIREGMTGVPPHHYELEHRAIPQYPRPFIQQPPWVRYLTEDPPVVGEDDAAGCTIPRPHPTVFDRPRVSGEMVLLMLSMLAVGAIAVWIILAAVR